MKKQNFCKKAAMFGLAGVLFAGNTIPAFAGQWIADENGRRWQRGWELPGFHLAVD